MSGPRTGRDEDGDSGSGGVVVPLGPVVVTAPPISGGNPGYGYGGSSYNGAGTGADAGTGGTGNTGAGGGSASGGASTSGSGPASQSTVLNISLTPCQTQVFNRLQNLRNGSIAAFLQRFAASNTRYNWRLMNGQLPRGTYGATGPFDRIYHVVTTTFDASQWRNATDLSIARTMMHEGIHAYLLSYFANDNSLARAEYVALINAMTAGSGLTQNQIQHNYMASGWINDLSLSLREYGTSMGYNLPNQFYLDLAWGGLQGTNVYNSLPQNDRDRINNVLLTEATGLDGQGNRRTQQGTPSGCP